MTFEENFYKKFPSYKELKDTSRYPEDNYFELYADSLGNVEYSVDAIMEDIITCCVDKKEVLRMLLKIQDLWISENGSSSPNYYGEKVINDIIKELGLEDLE